MPPQQLHNIEKKWKVKLPARFAELFDRYRKATHIRLATGKLFDLLPYALLTPDRIVSAADVAADWGLPDRVLPISGDFHDLLCLDFRAGDNPTVISLNDDRREALLCKCFDEFLDALIVQPETPANTPRAISVKLKF